MDTHPPTHTHTHTTYLSLKALVPVFVCKFSPDSLCGNLLAAGDEEGSVRLMNTRRVASHSVIRGTEHIPYSGKLGEH